MIVSHFIYKYNGYIVVPYSLKVQKVVSIIQLACKMLFYVSWEFMKYPVGVYKKSRETLFNFPRDFLSIFLF